MSERANLIDEYNNIIKDIALENGAIQYDRDRVQTSPENDMMIKIHERIEMRSKYIRRRLEWIDNETTTIKDLINSMKNATYKRLLYLIYIEGRGLESATESVNYSIENKARLHGDALNAFQQIMTLNDIE